jgi:hypothetical protein
MVKIIIIMISFTFFGCNCGCKYGPEKKTNFKVEKDNKYSIIKPKKDKVKTKQYYYKTYGKDTI